jgi:hypothetical protein
METPPNSCRIFGLRDFIRVPAPAARTMTAAGPVPDLDSASELVDSRLTDGTPCWSSACGLSGSAHRIRTYTPQLQRLGCCHYTRADHALPLVPEAPRERSPPGRLHKNLVCHVPGDNCDLNGVPRLLRPMPVLRRCRSGGSAAAEATLSAPSMPFPAHRHADGCQPLRRRACRTSARTHCSPRFMSTA